MRPPSTISRKSSVLSSSSRMVRPAKEGVISELHDFAAKIRVCMHAAFNNGLGTRDLAGPKGLTTEAFVDVIAAMLEGQPIDALVKKYNPDAAALKEIKVSDDIDQEAVSCHAYSSMSAS